MALVLTKEQETALVDLLKREMDRPTLLEDLKAAEAAQAATEQAFFAEREAEEIKLNTAISAINVAYAPERAAKAEAVEAAKAALAATQVAKPQEVLP